MAKGAGIRKPAENKTEKTIERVFDPHFVRCYSNTAQIESTQMDFRIRFGEIEKIAKDKVIVREVAFVSMSPQHAAAFSNLLSQSVQQYVAKMESSVKESERDEQKGKK